MNEGTFNFPDDRLIIINPTIFSIDEDNIQLNNNDKTITVWVFLVDPSGTRVAPLKAFENIPRDSQTWDDCDLVSIVTKRLLEFKTSE
jgi:hypothetical protein